MAERSRYHDRAGRGKQAFHFLDHVSNFGSDLSATPDHITHHRPHYTCKNPTKGELLILPTFKNHIYLKLLKLPHRPLADEWNVG